MIEGNSQKNNELAFPAEWTYTIIGADKALMSAAVKSVIITEKYTLRDSKKSSGGKYLSLEIRLQVQSKEQKDHFYTALASNKDIKMVL